MAIVILCNIVKIVCFAVAVQKQGYYPLVTLGDGLTSFLERPDTYTKDIGPASAADIREANERAQVCVIVSRRGHDGRDNGTTDDQGTSWAKIPVRLQPWRSKGRRWFSGASKLRWFSAYIL